MTNEEIQELIDEEIIVDCYDHEEVMMSWFYYFQDNLEFPFKAQVELKNLAGEKALRDVNVIGLAMNERDFKNSELPFEITIEGVDLILEVNIKYLKNVDGSEDVLEAFEIWNYWYSRTQTI